MMSIVDCDALVVLTQGRPSRDSRVLKRQIARVGGGLAAANIDMKADEGAVDEEETDAIAPLEEFTGNA